MDNKTNADNKSNPNNGNATVRDSLVESEKCGIVERKTTKRTRDISSGKHDSDDSDSTDSSHHRHHKRSKKSKKKKLKKKKSKKAKKSKHVSDSSSSDFDRSKDEKHKKKKMKDIKKSIDKPTTSKTPDVSTVIDDSASFGPAVPDDLLNKSKAMVPMTKEEWEKQQSRIRRVYDSESGRHRLVRGDGEIIEECVSRDRHRQINKQATAADGLFFQTHVSKK